MKAKFIELISTPSGRGKVLIYVIVAMLIFATVKGIVNGVKDSIRMTHAVMGGANVNDLLAREKKESQQRQEEKRKHFKSTFYCICHPLDYIDFRVGKAWHARQEKKKQM